MILDNLSSIAIPLIRFAGWNVVFSTVLFACVFVISRGIPRRYYHVRYLLWSLVLLRLVLPPGFSSPYSIGNLLGEGPGHLGLAAAEMVWETVRVAADPSGAHGGSDGFAVDWEWALELGRVVLLVFWVVGVGIVGGRLAGRRRAYQHIVRHARAVTDPRLLSALETWRRAFRIRRRVRLLAADAIPSPFTLGSVRPTIVIPRDAASRHAPGVLDCAIAHELAHIKRWDDLVFQLQAVLSTLYFFHPVVWLAGRSVRDEADHACDALVLAGGGISPRVYGRSLLAFLRSSNRTRELRVASPAFAASARHVQKRIESIMQSTHGPTRTFLPSASVLLLGVFCLPMAAGQAMGGSDRSTPNIQPQAQELRLLNPVPGARVASPFGERPSRDGGPPRHHSGIDLVAARGTPVRAAAGGTVSFAASGYSEQPIRGNVVLIDHGDGYKTYYGQLDSIGVDRGQRVGAGDAVGTLGSSGVSSGPHLHFEVWRRDTPVNPDEFVDEWKRPR